MKPKTIFKKLAGGLKKPVKVEPPILKETKVLSPGGMWVPEDKDKPCLFERNASGMIDSLVRDRGEEATSGGPALRVTLLVGLYWFPSPGAVYQELRLLGLPDDSHHLTTYQCFRNGRSFVVVNNTVLLETFGIIPETLHLRGNW